MSSFLDFKVNNLLVCSPLYQALDDPRMGIKERIDVLYQNRQNLYLDNVTSNLLIEKLAFSLPWNARMVVFFRLGLSYVNNFPQNIQHGFVLVTLICPTNETANKIIVIGRSLQKNLKRVGETFRKIEAYPRHDPRRDTIVQKLSNLVSKWEAEESQSLQQTYRTNYLTEQQRSNITEQLMGSLQTQKQVARSLFNKLEKIIGMRKALVSTHYVFSHASEFDCMLLYWLFKELGNYMLPRKDLRHLLIVRGPAELTKEEQAKMAQIRDDALSKGANSLDYLDMPGRKSLSSVLSVDICYVSTSPGESAISFADMASGSRVPIKARSRAPCLLEDELKRWNIPTILRENFISRFCEIINSLKEDGLNVWGLAIPKEKVLSLGYLAHAGGEFCRCHMNQDLHQLLNKIQNLILDETTLCVSGEKQVGLPAQYRLYPEQMTPENGVFLECFDDFSNKTRKRIKRELGQLSKAIALAAYSYNSLPAVTIPRA